MNTLATTLHYQKREKSKNQRKKTVGRKNQSKKRAERRRKESKMRKQRKKEEIEEQSERTRREAGSSDIQPQIKMATTAHP